MIHIQDTDSKEAIKDALTGSEDKMFDKIRVPELPRIRKEVCTLLLSELNDRIIVYESHSLFKLKFKSFSTLPSQHHSSQVENI